MCIILNKSLTSYFFFVIKNRKNTIISAVIILVVALISLVWFGGNYMLIGTDLIFPSNRIVTFLRTFSIWDPSSLGSANPRMLAWSFPNGVFLAFSSAVGLSLVSAEKLWFYFLFAFSGLSMYYMVTAITKNKNRYAIGVVAALFYMFNPYIALGITAWPYLWLTYASLPLMLGLFIKGINERKGLKYIILVNLILWVTSSSQYVNPKYVIVDWVPLLFYLVFYLLTSKDRSESFRALRFTVFLLCLWTLVNIYWILPAISYSFQIITSPSGLYSAIGRTRLADFTLNSASLPNSLRLLGSWLLSSGFGGYPYVYWAPTYSSTLFVFIGFLIPIVAFVPLIFKKEKAVLFFGIFLVASLLFMNGALSPFGKLNTFLFTHVPLAIDVFSLPYVFFGLYAIIGFAVLFGYGTMLISNYLAQKHAYLPPKLKKITKPVIAGIIIFLVVGLYAFPIWTGEVAYPGNALLSSSRYQIPNYYYKASSWLSSDPSDFRLFSLPYSIIGYVSYDWEPSGYQGPDPTESLLGRSVVVGSENGDLSSVIAQLIVSNSTVDVAKLLALLNVKYIVFHNDVNWQFLNQSAGQDVIASYITTSQQNFEAILASPQDGFTLCKSFGQLDFYINDYWQPMSVYAASTSILSEGNITQLIQIAERTDFKPNDSVITLSNQLDPGQISALPMNSAFIPDQGSSLTYDLLPNLSNNTRLIYVLGTQPVLTAIYYSGWKEVVSTNGQGDSSTIIFQSPSTCPYIDFFPLKSTSWNALNSTLIYINTGSLPLTVSSVQADGNPIGSLAWWATGASWETNWPIVIPANQKAIIQVPQQANLVSLQTDSGTITLQVTKSSTNPLSTQAPSELASKVFISDAGSYLLATKVLENDRGNLLIRVDNQTFRFDALSQAQQTALSYEYIGPLNLTAGYHTITIASENTTLENSSLRIDSMLLYSVMNGESFLNADNLLSSNQQNSTSLTFKEISSTQYTIHVNSSSPFYLVLSQSYDSGWVATINGRQIPDQYHFTANGYANGWYINKTGMFTITLEFTPQNLFYAAAAISITTLVLCSMYLSKNKIKGIYQKNIAKKVGD
jgi:hypothetical protein